MQNINHCLVSVHVYLELCKAQSILLRKSLDVFVWLLHVCIAEHLTSLCIMHFFFKVQQYFRVPFMQ